MCIGISPRFLLVLAFFASGVHAQEPGEKPPAKRWPPRLLLNSDCGTPVFYKFDENGGVTKLPAEEQLAMSQSSIDLSMLGKRHLKIARNGTRTASRKGRSAARMGFANPAKSSTSARSIGRRNARAPKRSTMS